MTAVVVRGDAARLPLPDACVDLVVTSPPYFGLRSYADGGEHYEGQIGSEATPAEYLEALWACTAEWVRVLKPGGSLFINLGDKYASAGGAQRQGENGQMADRSITEARRRNIGVKALREDPGLVRSSAAWGYPNKSLMLLPQRYAIGCTDRLGLILRAEIVWAKPNGLPESVTDRVRRSHEQVFHFTRLPRYYSAVDEIREPHMGTSWATAKRLREGSERMGPGNDARIKLDVGARRGRAMNPLGKLPGSVWQIPSAPLVVPECRLVWGGRTVRWFMTWAEGRAYMRRLARDRAAWRGRPGRPSLRPEADHFAAFPPELVRRIVLGWSPPGVCTACGEGRRPVAPRERYGEALRRLRVEAGLSQQDVANALGCHVRSLSDWEDEGHLPNGPAWDKLDHLLNIGMSRSQFVITYDHVDTGSGDTDLRRRAQAAGAARPYARRKVAVARQGGGYACACPVPDAPARPAVVLDPFGGTGTTALVASAYGRVGITVDRSMDYARLARWRTRDPGERARALGVPKPPPVPDGQGSLFDEELPA